MKMTKTIDLIAVMGCMAVAMVCAVKISADLEDGMECKIALDQERALRLQAEDIKLKMVEEQAEDWCSDSIEHAYQALDTCEKTGITDIYYPEECTPCWNLWSMDMTATCETLFSDRRDALEKTIFMRSTIDLWADYVHARIKDCESRNLKTRAEREACLGPAARGEEIMQAFDAMSLHQESRSLGYL